MTGLAVGAGRDGLRAVLVRDGIPIERVVTQPVRERNDATIIDAFLLECGVTWSTIDRYLLLMLPHSKTTVRIMKTLVTTSGRYYDRPVGILPVDSLQAVDLEAIQHELGAITGRFDEHSIAASE